MRKRLSEGAAGIAEASSDLWFTSVRLVGVGWYLIARDGLGYINHRSLC